MTVPKAPVDEDREFASGEEDVGCTRQFADVLPEPVAGIVERSSEGQFGSSVLAPDTAHDRTPLGFGYAVHPLPSATTNCALVA